MPERLSSIILKKKLSQTLDWSLSQRLLCIALIGLSVCQMKIEVILKQF
jgi:hypothetical protein